MLTKEEKQELVQQYGQNEKDTGSAEVQIAFLTARIKYLTDHFKKQPKDFDSRRGLLKMVGQRRGFLNYVKSRDNERYLTITQKLGIRK